MIPRGNVGRVWTVAVTSGLGAWMVQVAVFVWILREYGAPSLALLVLAGQMPAFLLAPGLGTWIDRRDPGPLLRCSIVAQAGVVVVLLAFIHQSLVLFAAGYATFNLVRAAGTTARQRLLYAMIDPGERPAANAVIGSVTGLVTIVGAALGGTMAWVGLGPVLLGAAAIQGFGVFALGSSQPYQGCPHVPLLEPYGRSVRDGFQALRQFPRATSVLLVGMAWGLIGGGYDVLLTDYGVHRLHGGAPGLGVLYVTDGVGVMVGAWLARRLGARWRGHIFASAYLLQGVFWTLFALSARFAIAIPFLLVMRVASGIIIAWDTTLLLETVPDSLHGRVFSLHAATYGAVMRLSLALTGVLLAVVGPEGVAVGAGVGSVLVGVTWWFASGRLWPGDPVPHGDSPSVRRVGQPVHAREARAV